MSRLEGTVRWFNHAKGYGFLSRDDDAVDGLAGYSSLGTKGRKSQKDGTAKKFDVNGEDEPHSDQPRKQKK